MKHEIKRILKSNGEALARSDKTLRSIFDIMFSNEGLVLCESHDGFRTKKQTYGEIKRKIKRCAAGLYSRIGDTHEFVALYMDNSPDWIVAFWSILKSGNKPYLVNLRYPDKLTDSILQTLGVKYVITDGGCSLSGDHIPLSSLSADGEVPDTVFEDEIAFSSSATSMNEVICFYRGFQISEQILNFRSIVKRDRSIAAHHKNSLKQLAFLPFYHVFGLFAVYFWFTFFNRTIVFLKDYSAETILKTCRRHEVTHIFAVPMLWHTIEKQVLATARQQGDKRYQKLQKGIEFATRLQNLFPAFGAEIAKFLLREVTDKLFGRSVKFCINGGSYLKPSALKLLNGIGYNLHNGYGMSEIGITSVELRRQPKFRNENSIGQPFDSVEYQLDEAGVLLVKGSSLCVKKMINRQEVTLNGWFHTGDIMTKTDGHYFILGRQSDVVIGENGENINPDTVEALFSLPAATLLSVVGIDGENGPELSLIVAVNRYITEDVIEQIKREAYAINNTLPTATAIRKFYFTFDRLAPPTAVKVSRTQLLKKLEAKEITLIPFADMTVPERINEQSPLMMEVRQIIAETLKVPEEKVTPTSHLFHDLGATSIDYFSCLTKLSEHFGISQYQKSDTYCYTLKEICEYIERHL